MRLLSYLVYLGLKKCYNIPGYLFTNITIWSFPKIGDSPNHPKLDQISIDTDGFGVPVFKLPPYKPCMYYQYQYQDQDQYQYQYQDQEQYQYQYQSLFKPMPSALLKDRDASLRSELQAINDKCFGADFARDDGDLFN